MITVLSGLRIICMHTMQLETAKELRKGDKRGQGRMFRAALVHGGAGMITVSYRTWNPQNSLCSLAVLAGFGTIRTLRLKSLHKQLARLCEGYNLVGGPDWSSIGVLWMAWAWKLPRWVGCAPYACTMLAPSRFCYFFAICMSWCLSSLAKCVMRTPAMHVVSLIAIRHY